MKTTLLTSGLILFCGLSLSASAAESRGWYLEFSAGGGNSSGGLEMESFYNLSSTFSGEIGYRITPWLAVVPVSLNYHSFRFKEGNYERNYLGYIDEYHKRRRAEWFKKYGGYGDVYIQDFWVAGTEAVSGMWGVSWTPSVLFRSPELAGLRASLRVGGGLYYYRASIIQSYSSIDYNGGRLEMEYGHGKGENSSPGVLMGAGLEYRLAGNYSLVLNAAYHLVFTGKPRRNVSLLDLDGIWFFRMNGDDLQYHRFLTEKNTGVFEVKGGMRINLP
ncbi:MAG: hypothetical protein V1794_15770 [Candidatus Glassbacteria bacterium]